MPDGLMIAQSSSLRTSHRAIPWDDAETLQSPDTDNAEEKNSQSGSENGFKPGTDEEYLAARAQGTTSSTVLKDGGSGEKEKETEGSDVADCPDTAALCKDRNDCAWDVEALRCLQNEEEEGQAEKFEEAGGIDGEETTKEERVEENRLRNANQELASNPKVYGASSILHYQKL